MVTGQLVIIRLFKLAAFYIIKEFIQRLVLSEVHIDFQFGLALNLHLVLF